jgi:hypothetical protein
MNLVEEKKKQLSSGYKQKTCKLVKKVGNLNFKKKVDKIHKLIVKKFKLNVDCHIKIGRNHNLFQV